jgi:hypothetical protein
MLHKAHRESSKKKKSENEKQDLPPGRAVKFATNPCISGALIATIPAIGRGGRKSIGSVRFEAIGLDAVMGGTI